MTGVLAGRGRERGRDMKDAVHREKTVGGPSRKAALCKARRDVSQDNSPVAH